VDKACTGKNTRIVENSSLHKPQPHQLQTTNNITLFLRPIDPSSVHPAIASMQKVEDHDEAIRLLAELRAISDGSAAASRFDKLSVTEQGRGGDDQSFIGNTPENSNFNQYWYSSKTIEVLTTAILETLILFEGKSVAFLSTPSLYFALPEEKRKHCKVFEVRL